MNAEATGAGVFVVLKALVGPPNADDAVGAETVEGGSGRPFALAKPVANACWYTCLAFASAFAYT